MPCSPAGTRCTAGTIGAMSSAMCGGSGVASGSVDSIAAATAPHSSWPSTRISGTSSTATAYSSEPITESEITWPALRTTKRSPRPLSKMISAARRESLQPNSAACGACACGELLAALDVLPRMLRFAGDEALVAAHHLLPHLGGGSEWGIRRAPSRRPRRAPRTRRRRRCRRARWSSGSRLGDERVGDVAGIGDVTPVVAGPRRAADRDDGAGLRAPHLAVDPGRVGVEAPGRVR